MLSRKGVNTAASAPSAASPSASLSSVASAESGGEVEKFAREVLQQLSQENLPPFPSYYQLYFEKMLDEKPYEFRKSITEMIETESNTEDEKRMRMEQQLQDGFALFKEILQNVATLFKNVSTMTNVSKRRMVEAKGINNPSAVQNLTLALNNDLEKLTKVLNMQAVTIKNLYTKSAKIIQEVKGETIYDAQYGIFNKRYLAEQLATEIAQMSKFNHQSSLIIAKLSSKIRDKISNEKQLGLINRTISKLFMKTSRRSDVVAHYGDGSFAMLLKHTDEQNATRAALRVADMTSGSHFFIADQEIKLEIAIGISVLSTRQDAETVMVRALDAMNKADTQGKTYEIAPSGESDEAADSNLA
ncbi:MAG: GGDEF domain-containing protein [Campylobacterales bacterium]